MQDDLVQDSHRQTAQVPRGSRSAAIPVTDSRATTTAPAVPPAPASTPPPQTSAEVFADAAISTPTSTQTGAASRARSDAQLYTFSNFLVTCCQRGRNCYRSQGFERESALSFFFVLLPVFLEIHWFLLVPDTLSVLATTFDATLMSAQSYYALMCAYCLSCAIPYCMAIYFCLGD